MATKLKLYKNALLLLRARPVDTVTDDRKERYILDAVYDDTLAYMLEQGLWNFATRTLAIEASDDVESEFGFAHVMEKPDDYAGRIVAISGDAYFSLPLERYHDEGPYIYCDVDPLYLRYVSNGASYGADLSRWPATYTRAVEHELAFRVAPHLTTLGEGGMDELEKRRLMALRDARSKDALNQAAERPPPGRLVRARAGGRWDSWRDR